MRISYIERTLMYLEFYHTEFALQASFKLLVLAGCNLSLCLKKFLTNK